MASGTHIRGLLPRPPCCHPATWYPTLGDLDLSPTSSCTHGVCSKGGNGGWGSTPCLLCDLGKSLDFSTLCFLFCKMGILIMMPT